MNSGLFTIAEVASAPRATLLGAVMPSRFGDVVSECRAVRESAGVFAGNLRSWVLMTGADRVDFLHGMVSNDVRSVQPGQGTYAALLTQQGRVVTDLRIYAGSDLFLLDVPTAAASTMRGALERYIVADDVEMVDDGATLIALEGPDARPVLERAGAPWPGDALALRDGRIAGAAVRLATASHTGETGVLIAVEEGSAESVWQALRSAGATPIGAEALNVLRVEAGIPWIGVDMDESALVVEAGLDWAISFTKGCYLGQEVVERVTARGHVNRVRVGLVFEGAAPPAGTPLQTGGREIGFVSSAVHSPLLAATIGMGYARRELAAPGTALEVSFDDRMESAETAEMPFVVTRATTRDVPHRSANGAER